jgi:hypothetical protein
MSKFDVGTKIISENGTQYIIDDIKVISNDVGVFLRKTSKDNEPITKVISVLDLKKYIAVK